MAGSARYSLSSGRTVLQPPSASRATTSQSHDGLEEDCETRTELLLRHVLIRFVQHPGPCFEPQGDPVLEAGWMWKTGRAVKSFFGFADD
jgi:hypothetical protein